MEFFRKHVLLICIVFLAAFARFWQLGAVPASMNADEVAIGYNAYSLLHTGKDEYKKPYPLLFRSFDDYKLPLYVYLTVPSVAIFGLTDMSVRLPSAVFGTLTVVASYFFLIQLFKRRDIALLTSVLLAISPWHLQFSRSAYEANIAVFFAVTGFALLLRGLERGNSSWWGFVSLALSVWSYHSSRIFIPLMLLGFFFIYRSEMVKRWKVFVLGFMTCVIVCLPLVWLSVSPEGLVRARGVSALGDPVAVARNAAWRLTDVQENMWGSGVYHNHRLVDVMTILKGYLMHFSPHFFFLEAVQGKYHAPGVGLLYLWELPVLLLGLRYLSNIKNKGKYLVFAWFFLAPVAAAPTFMLPHPVRTLIFLPTLQIFVAFGLLALWECLEHWTPVYKKILVSFGLCMVLVNGGYYFHQYYVHAPIEYAREWQYGHEQVVHAVQAVEKHFDHIVVSTSLDQPYIFFLYYLGYDPASYQAQGGTISGKFDEERNTFDKYAFHAYADPQGKADPRTLYVGTPEERLPGLEPIEEIKSPQGDIIYTLYATDKPETLNK